MADSISAMPSGPRPRGTHRASTIRDVASLAGVSKSTASRALLGQAGVSPDNLEKVRQAVLRLDYVPNQIARSLSASSPTLLGLFVRQSGSPFYAQLAGAFESQAGVHGYEVLSVSSDDRPDEANYRSLMVLADLRAAGIVVATPTVDPRTIRQIASRVPLVLVGQMGQPDNPDVPFVAPDPTRGEVLIDHIAGLGHESIALTANPPEHSPTQWARVELMQKQLQDRRLAGRFTVLQPGTSITRTVDELHRAGITAILCNDDTTALDAIAAAEQLGLSVPRDISIAGHDGMAPLDHAAIGLTTYRVPIEAMAAASVELVEKLVRAEKVTTGGVLLTGKFIEGRTTGPPPPP
ncbi:hypothetical protein CFP66_34330 [Pseudonocardia sp. MH-G8]|nr:hypothetical protein CFP66_34330 [Pseudonocardia sp. MH-G8]